MKAIKIFALGAMLTLASAPIYAQTDGKAAIEQVENILNSQAPDADKQIAKIAGKFKKDAATLTEIGRMYYYTKNYDKALEYAEKAKAASKFKFGGAYVLSGDIAAANDDGGTAAEHYQQAQYLDPTNPDGYIRYAYLMRKSGLGAALGVLETLKQNNPDFDTNLPAAEICKSVDNNKKAMEYYAKVDKNKMTEKQLVDWSTDLYFAKEYQASLETALAGLKNYPTNPALARLTFYNYAASKDYDQALTYANKLFNETKDMKPISLDYQILASVYEQTQQYEKAADAYKTLAGLEDTKEAMKDFANKNVAAMYMKENKFAEGISAFQDYLNNGNNVTLADYKTLVKYLTQKEEAAVQGEENPTFPETTACLKGIAEKFPEAKTYVNASYGRLAVKSKDGEAIKAAYENLINEEMASGNPDTNMLAEGYLNLMVYYLQFAKDYEQTFVYAQKVLEVDPTNETAKKVVDAMTPKDAAPAQ